MIAVYPFRALMPAPGLAGKVASVPYDVVTRFEARRIGSASPASFLHVIRPEIDLPDDTPEHDDRVYDTARVNFERFMREGILVESESPAFYLYRLETAGISHTGLVACCSVEDYNDGRIKRHELTRHDKEDDRARHIERLGAHTGPVLMVYRSTAGVRTRLRTATARATSDGRPLWRFVAADGVLHTGWRIENTDRVIASFDGVDALYIADGHHRAAAASRVAAARPSSAEASRFLCVLFPHDGLRILPYNRYLALGEKDAEALVAAVEDRFGLSEAPDGSSPGPGEVRLYYDRRWRAFRLRPAAEAGPAERLDPSLFDREVLRALAGIDDPRRDDRLDFVGGPGSAKELARRVDSNGGVAFTFHPVSVEELMAVADAGEIMPPKSTWFSPKPLSGLFVHRFA